MRLCDYSWLMFQKGDIKVLKKGSLTYRWLGI